MQASTGYGIAFLYLNETAQIFYLVLISLQNFLKICTNIQEIAITILHNLEGIFWMHYISTVKSTVYIVWILWKLLLKRLFIKSHLKSPLQNQRYRNHLCRNFNLSLPHGFVKHIRAIHILHSRMFHLDKMIITEM